MVRIRSPGMRGLPAGTFLFRGHCADRVLLSRAIRVLQRYALALEIIVAENHIDLLAAWAAGARHQRVVYGDGDHIDAASWRVESDGREIKRNAPTLDESLCRHQRGFYGVR